ncbi:PPM2 [Candida jiufengensis]|uniref:PPM2 n=1 Tax=Candida jiufengensis TaxID=497108 RepID=UPI00222593DF|nr:PPM2 [Candida jiufengensis]KAI5955729.1 PPM2 [Candida jiufengensis]
MKQQNLKKLEKQNRKQKYDDQQVQGTNNSSIVSKRSVENLYFSQIQPHLGEWFKEFVPKGKRRSPAINRGYWIRMESIRSTVIKIINSNKGKRINVINLGCGFDPLAFQLLSTLKDNNLNFIDIDYPDLINEKYNHIQNSSKIQNLIGEPTPSEFKLNCKNYKLIGCDLKQTSQYQNLINTLFSTTTDQIHIFIAEVSLAYMNPKYANPIIEISSYPKNSHFIILEQIMPDGPFNAFATKMLYHFNHLRSPIQCVGPYPTKQKQIERFLKYYKNVEINNLFENWEIVNDEIKLQIAKIEEFDEWEEFILFCQHYFVIHASNDIKQTKQEIIEDIKFEIDESVKFELVGSDKFELKFPAIAKFNDKIIINGGLKQIRTNETLQLNQQGQLTSIQTTNSPSPRMCHSLTSIGSKLILIGGRSKPNDILSDIYEFDGLNWTQIAKLEQPRYRHSVVILNDEELLIFGGTSTNENSFIKFNITTKKITNLKVESEMVSLFSASMNYSNGVGYIYGGFNETHLPKVNDKLYKFHLENDTIYIRSVMQDIMLSRIGSQAIQLEDKLIIIGGISSSTILIKYTNILTLDLTNLKFNSVEISEELYKIHPPIFIGFSVVELNSNESLVLGGGAVCYSFGSCYNGVYKLKY